MNTRKFLKSLNRQERQRHLKKRRNGMYGGVPQTIECLLGVQILAQKKASDQKTRRKME
jgi:hypothetical protein